MADSVVVRRALIRLCESKRARIVTFTADMPSRWQPRQFTDPRTRQAFTDESAWTYIVQHLEGGIEFQEIILERPPGAKAFVLFLPGVNTPKIYVKLQVYGGRVIGRSFHESEMEMLEPAKNESRRGPQCRKK
jgi:hypothetical protein